MKNQCCFLFTLVAFLFLHSSGDAHNCDVYSSGDLMIADCKNRNLTKVPDLPETVQVLDLSGNNLRCIGNDSFVRYRLLVSLYLNNSNVRDIEKYGFRGMKNLKQLTLIENYLNVSNDDGINILENIPNIAHLDFGNQKTPSDMYGFVQYPDTIFKNLTQLETLSLDLYGYPVLGPGFKHLRQLQSLHFRSCLIKYLQNKTFQYLPDSIKTIDMSQCYRVDASSTEIGLFGPFPNLTSLDMSWTPITLTKGLELLRPLRNRTMELINFGHMQNRNTNKTQLPFAIILTSQLMQHINTICVKNLILADNNIVDILPHSLFDFQHPHCIEFFDLSGNKFGFSSFSMTDLVLLARKFYNLKVFDFSYLALQYLNPQWMTYPPPTHIRPTVEYDKHLDDTEKCKHANVNETLHLFLPGNLKYVRITYVLGVPETKYKLALHNVSKLTHIDMSYYHLRCFPDVVYNNPTENNLEFLDISGIESRRYYTKTSLPFFSKLTTLIMSKAQYFEAINENINVLVKSPNLQYLDLSWNGLWMIPPNYLTHLRNLSNLILSNNNFRQIPDDISHLPNLKVLVLTDNRLYTIPSHFMNWFVSQLRRLGEFKLYVQYNDFYCNCEHTDLVRWLSNTNITHDKVRNYMCRLHNGSNAYINTVNRQFHDIFADCDANMWLRVGIVIIATFFSVFLPAAILFNFRWRIAFFCYRKFRRLVERSVNLSYKYDVYVAYAYNGYPWVLEFLVPLLESRWGLEVCLEDRDFDGGKLVQDEMNKSIIQSRHMIFVVTSDFMSKPFAVYEIDQAKLAKSANSLQKIIVVALQLTMTEVPMELRSIWSDVSLLEWQNNSEEICLENLKTRILLNF